MNENEHNRGAVFQASLNLSRKKNTQLYFYKIYIERRRYRNFKKRNEQRPTHLIYWPLENPPEQLLGFISFFPILLQLTNCTFLFQLQLNIFNYLLCREMIMRLNFMRSKMQFFMISQLGKVRSHEKWQILLIS